MKQPRRRGNKSGTVYRSGHRWRWQFVADGGTRTGGYADTRKDAEEALATAIVRNKTGAPAVDTSETVAHYLARWLEDRKRDSVKASTYEGYRHVVNRVLPFLGDIRLDRLSARQIQHAYAQLSHPQEPGRRPLQASTVRQTHAVLYDALQGAVQWQLIMTNPAEFVSLPKVERKERVNLGADEARRLLDAADGHRFQALWTVLAYAGLRISEALDLQWRDVDLDRGELAIRVGKTQAATRTVLLVSTARSALVGHRQAQRLERMKNRDVWLDTPWVFTDEIGDQLRQWTVRYQFRRVVRDAGLPHMRMHDLRRTTISLLREAGVEVDVVQRIVGHRSISTTIDVYGHVSRGRLEEARQRLDDYLRRAE